VADGIEQALKEGPRPGQKRRLDGRAEATLIASACTEAPEGHEHWSLRLLAGKLEQLGVVDTVFHETVRQMETPTELTPRCGKAGPEFVKKGEHLRGLHGEEDIEIGFGSLI